MKYKKATLTLLIILLITIGITVSYALINFDLEKYIELIDEKSITSKDDPLPTEKDAVTARNYTFTLNDKQVDLQVVFTSYIAEADGYTYRTIEGRFQDNLIYYSGELADSDADYTFNKHTVEKALGEDNFQIIKGTDSKDYLMIITSSIPYGNDLAFVKNAYIFNDQLKLVYDSTKEEQLSSQYYFTIALGNMSKHLSLENVDPWYDDSFGSCSYATDCHVKLKIEQDKIYYLMTSDYETLEERIYTISNDTLTYESTASYALLD